MVLGIEHQYPQGMQLTANFYNRRIRLTMSEFTDQS